MLNAATLLFLLGMASALPQASPTRPNLDSVCRADTCSDDDCPLFIGIDLDPGENAGGSCPAFSTEIFEEKGFGRDETGAIDAWFNIRDPGEGCKVTVRSPVVPDSNGCGEPVLVVEDGSQCARVPLKSTYIIQRCCGVEQCSLIGAKRDGNMSPRDIEGPFAHGGQVLTISDKNGKPIQPTYLPIPSAKPALSKRQGECKWVNDGELFKREGTQQIISNRVSCPRNTECMATLGASITQEFSLSVSVSVGDPLGIVSVTAGFEFSQSTTREFSGTFTFGPGETGYVVFTPILTCQSGHFEGDCSGDQDKGQMDACSATEVSPGQMDGSQRGVVVLV